MKSRQLIRCVVFVFFLIACRPVASQDSWPAFRGADGNGEALGARLPLEFSNENNIRWETSIHGRGWSSPVIWENQVWLTTATEDGTTMSLICVDLESGEILSDQVIHENESPSYCHPTNSYASPTPVIEKGRIYVHFGKYGTTCVDTQTGETIWQRTDLECDHYRGPASSPILFEDLVIVAFDGVDQQYVIALDKNSGKTVWKKDRAIDYGTDNGDLKKAYGTGSVFNVDGTPVLVCPSAVATTAYEPRTGRQVWIAYHGGMNASSRPVMSHNGLVMLTNGMGKMVAVDPGGTGDVTETHLKWRLGKAVAKKSSLLVVGQYVYMISDNGVVSCVDPETGTSVWQKRIGGKFSASPVYDGERIYLFSEEGDVHAIQPGAEFVELGKFRIGDGFRASPAISGQRTILRSVSKLYCVSRDSDRSESK